MGPKSGLESVEDADEGGDDDGTDAATTRPPTQDPNRTRPSTFDPNRTTGSMASAGFSDSFLTQGPLEDSPEACYQRHGALMQEAEMRAEHQGLAQKTMIDLARAVEEAHGYRKDLARTLQSEQEVTAEWQRKYRGLQAELERAGLEAEKLLAELIVHRGFEKGNTVFIGMMLEKSREAYESRTFSSVFAGAGGEADAEGEAAGEASASPPIPVGQESLDLREVISVSVVDRLLFKWIFKLWYRESRKPKPVTTAETIIKTEVKVVNNDDYWKAQLEEQEKKLRAEFEQKLRSSQKPVVQVQAPVETAFIDEAPALKDKIRALEKLLEAARAEAVEIDKRHFVVEDDLRGEILKGKEALSTSQAEVEKCRQELVDAQVAWKKVQAGHEAEKKKLLKDISTVQSELKQALVLSKYMREAMLKVKRDAAGKVAPEKLAELIEQLEVMREHLDRMGRDYRTEREAHRELMEKMETNRRRFELERQFLPLIHRARGPLGPKLKVPPEEGEGVEGQDGLGNDAAAMGDSRKMQRSMSAAGRSGPKSFAGAAAQSP
mmetsp:Transcript_18455/g.38067  ORF Transcript_18455/g.38067 Transcript_18455/m.38067 type:complete len:550 (+) Transcript_18455:150-1799(+)